MKRITAALLASFLLLSMSPTAVLAESTTPPGSYEVDGSIGFGTGPNDFDTGFGFNFGGGYMLDPNLQARFDISYFDFSRNVPGTSLDYTRIPLVLSARYYVPLFGEQLKGFGQAGVELSFDSFDNMDVFGKHSKTEANLGLTPGAGVEYFFNPQLSAFALGNFHLVSDTYFAMQFGAAVHF